MKTYYEVHVKHEKQDQQTGKFKKVTEPYLIDAVSFGDAESRITDIMNKQLAGDFELKADKIVNYSKVINLPGDIYYKCKLMFQTIDNKGKEKFIPEYYLIKADDIGSSFGHLSNNFEGRIASISETKIVDVFEWKE